MYKLARFDSCKVLFVITNIDSSHNNDIWNNSPVSACYGAYGIQVHGRELHGQEYVIAACIILHGSLRELH